MWVNIYYRRKPTIRQIPHGVDNFIQW